MRIILIMSLYNWIEIPWFNVLFYFFRVLYRRIEKIMNISS